MAITNASSHLTGQGALTHWTPQLVAQAPDPARAYALYVGQVVGVPWATQKDLVILRKRINELFAHYPRVTYHTLCRLAQWCRTKGIRRQRVWEIVDLFRQAWAEKALPELDEPQHDRSVESRIIAALEIETNRDWRRRLLCAQGPTTRRNVLAAWEAAHGSL